jgi:hypothetical protein
MKSFPRVYILLTTESWSSVLNGSTSVLKFDFLELWDVMYEIQCYYEEGIILFKLRFQVTFRSGVCALKV